MNIKTTVYDLLGYIVPGLVTMTLSIVVYIQNYPIQNISDAITFLSPLFNIYFSMLIICIAYVIGFFMSGIGDLYNDIILVKIHSSLKRDSLIRYLEGELFNRFEQKFKETFKNDFKETHIRKLICYVESNKPELYSTAFYYLSFYGMSRSLFVIFSLFALTEIVLLILPNPCVLITLILIIVSLLLAWLAHYQYIRFLKYFLEQIVCAFLI
jgi:hypothetical protein